MKGRPIFTSFANGVGVELGHETSSSVRCGAMPTLTANRQLCRHPGKFPQQYVRALFRNLFQTGKLQHFLTLNNYGSSRAKPSCILCLWPTQLWPTLAESGPKPYEKMDRIQPAQPASWRGRSVSNQPPSAVFGDSCQPCAKGARDSPKPTLSSDRSSTTRSVQPHCGMESRASRPAGARRVRSPYQCST